ncbi:MAG: response regulator [Chloroflexi bacterium]|jgi:CheY-like chemotaxis protein|nr:response regulator [Chloroflexota bacterium]
MGRLMLIDDNEVVVNLLKTLLEMEGFEIITNPQGDFLEAIQREEPDLILMDVYLKDDAGRDVDGFQFLDAIRQNFNLSDTRIIMSSGIDFRAESKKRNANGFILKPYMPDDLIQLINHVLAV